LFACKDQAVADKREGGPTPADDPPIDTGLRTNQADLDRIADGETDLQAYVRAVIDHPVVS
jgi:hypothetical protein